LADEKGKLRAHLSVYKDGPRLDLLDENGKLRVMLTVTKGGPGLGLCDEKGEPCAMLTVTKGGPGGARPSLRVIRLAGGTWRGYGRRRHHADVAGGRPRPAHPG